LPLRLENFELLEKTAAEREATMTSTSTRRTRITLIAPEKD
jgi:hypothetical protein